MFFSLITSVKSIFHRIKSAIVDKSGFSSIPRHDWFYFKLADKTILAFPKLEGYMLFQEFLNLCYFQIHKNYRLDTALRSNSNRRNVCQFEIEEISDLCYQLLDTKMNTDGIDSCDASMIYYGNPYALAGRNKLARYFHEINNQLNCTLNITVYSFLKFCRDRSFWTNDNPNKIMFMEEVPEHLYPIHLPINLDNFFMYREDLELLLILMKDVANILMATDWEYVYPNDEYVDFRPIKGDIIKFIKKVEEIKNSYPLHSPSFFASLSIEWKLCSIRYYFFKLRLKLSYKI